MIMFMQVVALLLQILTFAILARSILSWFPSNPGNPVANVINGVTEPILAPLRRIIPRVGRIDLTPTVAIILLMVFSHFLQDYH